MQPRKKMYEDFAETILNEVRRTMFGVEDVIRLCIVALYTEGHVLLEGNPGLGKTELVKALSRVLRLPFGRIQFTPDLMPSDITGTLMPDPHSGTSKLDFQPGPVFTSLLLADEINRATPKTQAAMLEAMAERQVTVQGTIYSLDSRDSKQQVNEQGEIESPEKGRPFIVLATQNPIDHEGTYDLPEAQSDRFMFKVLMPTPSEQTLLSIIAKKSGAIYGNGHADAQTSEAPRVRMPGNQSESTHYFHDIEQRIKQFPLNQDVQTHIINMFLVTNKQIHKIDTISSKQRKVLEEYAVLMDYGLGPRAAIALSLGAKAWSLFFIPGVAEADVSALAKIAIPVLRHRLRLNYSWYEQTEELYANVESDRRMDHFLKAFCLACAPTSGTANRAYAQLFEDAQSETINSKAF